MLRALAILMGLLLLGANLGILGYQISQRGSLTFTGPTPGEDTKKLNNLTVTVGGKNYGDLAIYDYFVLAETYWFEKDTGNWSLYRLTVSGTLSQRVMGHAKQRDGFGQQHEAAQLRQSTQANFILHFESNDADPMDIPGSLRGDRDAFDTLDGSVGIQAVTQGHVEIESLPRASKALAYDGYLRSYPNPNIPQLPSLDEQLMSPGRLFSTGQQGNITVTSGTADWNDEFAPFTIYNWTAPSAEEVNGYPAVLVNVTATFFGGFLNFNEDIWIGNDMSYPVKRTSRTNSSWDTNESRGHIVLETRNTVQKNGYTRGDSAVRWTDSRPAFRTVHPLAERKPWAYMPAPGAGFASSSVDFSQDEAIQYATDNSPGLRGFLETYENPERPLTIPYAFYNATPSSTDPDGKAGTYWWNLTWGYEPTRAEREEAQKRSAAGDEHAYDFQYRVVVRKDVTRTINPLNPYSSTLILEEDRTDRGEAERHKGELNATTVTLASAEEILETDEMVRNEMFRNGQIVWVTPDPSAQSGSIQTDLILGQTSIAGGGPGLVIVETLTGITPPSAEYAWALQKGKIFEGGNTFIASVDAQTGQWLFVADITGTSLLGVFDG